MVDNRRSAANKRWRKSNFALVEIYCKVHSKFERPIALKRLTTRFRAWSAARSIAYPQVGNIGVGFPRDLLFLSLSLSLSCFLLRACVLFVFTPFAFIYYQSADTNHGHQFGLTPAQQQFSNRCHFSRYSCCRCHVVVGIARARYRFMNRQIGQICPRDDHRRICEQARVFCDRSHNVSVQ